MNKDLSDLPVYICHKKVQAVKISNIEYDPNTGLYIISSYHHPDVKIPVDVEYMVKHRPDRGGYFVLYEDGYKSWSPADVFETGYALEKK